MQCTIRRMGSVVGVVSSTRRMGLVVVAAGVVTQLKMVMALHRMVSVWEARWGSMLQVQQWL